MTYQDSLSALADPTRRAVFEAVARGNALSVSQIAQGLPVSRPAVSQHLKVLGDAGLVQAKAVGNRRVYSVQPKGLADLRRWLDQFWGNVLENFANEINGEGRKYD